VTGEQHADTVRREFLVTIRETFQTQIRVDARSQAEAKRIVLNDLRRSMSDPPSYGGDPDELPRSIRLSAVAAWDVA
jgi:hypothetical protein